MPAHPGRCLWWWWVGLAALGLRLAAGGCGAVAGPPPQHETRRFLSLSRNQATGCSLLFAAAKVRKAFFVSGFPEKRSEMLQYSRTNFFVRAYDWGSLRFGVPRRRAYCVLALSEARERHPTLE